MVTHVPLCSNLRFLKSYPMLVFMRWLRLVPTYIFILAVGGRPMLRILPAMATTLSTRICTLPFAFACLPACLPLCLSACLPTCYLTSSLVTLHDAGRRLLLGPLLNYPV